MLKFKNNHTKGENMEIKQVVSLEVTKGDFTFTFNMPTGSSWGNAIDAAYELLSEVNKLYQNAVSSLQPASSSSDSPVAPVDSESQPSEGN